MHPFRAALYLKRVEGRHRLGAPIRPAAVSARSHAPTRLDGFVDRGHLRADDLDVEDFAELHVVFEDGTIADIFASEIVVGGIHNRLEVRANNHRTICTINPNWAMQTYNPVEAAFAEICVVEKIATLQVWAPTASDEDNITGFSQQVEAFYRAVATGLAPDCDSRLAADCISTVYSADLSADRAGAEVPVRANSDHRPRPIGVRVGVQSPVKRPVKRPRGAPRALHGHPRGTNLAPRIISIACGTPHGPAGGGARGDWLTRHDLAFGTAAPQTARHDPERPNLGVD